MSNIYISLFCLVDGEATSNAFPVEIESTKTIGDLKELIKSKKSPEFNDVAADKLTLWRVSIPVTDNKQPSVLSNFLKSALELTPTDDVSEVFPETPPKKTIHIIVLRPPPVHAPIPIPDHSSDESRPGSPLFDEKWPELLAQLRTSSSPLTPLLFLNLPESPEAQDPPSTADKALEKIRGISIPLLPLFGVSGCGKTRTAIEILSKNWGFYFNGSGTDWGSGDLLSFLDLVQQRKRYQNRDLASNTHVHILALALVISRVMMLQHCLNIAESVGITFTCHHWMLLQVGFRTMDALDLFDMLFTSIADVIHRNFMDITFMRTLARDRFTDLRQDLLNLTPNIPFQHSRYKILLVIDEAQNLGKHEFGTFLSQQVPSDAERQAGAAALDKYKRPILSPLVHGFYQIAADRNQFCVIPCGTGLSIFYMRWLEDSDSIRKGYQEHLGPFTDFQGWESLEQVQNYRDLVRRALPNDEARAVFDTRVPKTSVAELFARLRGRFRPIVSAIERMIRNNELNWKLAIEKTELSLTSTDVQYFGKGNIAYDIDRMISRVDQNKRRYAQYQNIRTVLQFFVLQHYLYGRPAILNTVEAPLVEASVGRIMDISGKTTGTVLDEPLVIRAAVNHFRQHDTDFHSSICSLFSQSKKPTVQGSSWEMAVLPSLVYVFDNKVLSDTALVPSEAVRSDSGLLDSKARIVGLDPHMLGTDSHSMSLNEFLEAHVENGSRSRKDGKQVPAFYNPAETPSGPDLVFVLHFDQYGFCPVFVQLKLRVSMDLAETQSAFTTAKADAVQGHLGVTKLERFCTVSPKRYFAIVVAYPTELPGVEGLFSQLRRSERIGATQTNQGPQCIALRIDSNNIHKLFPEAHMKLLDLLKGVKRELGQDGDDLEYEYAAKQRRL
ncbi:hypothetical protein BGZ95_005291 [Linnemannia exigua]|uniref:Crinkler effector protein N-terminal domain-containing protein n=1 Tax=Linnemannia exigua TaxID=604196 RepID=A0AAD4D2L5_9FUNG|nr:hypothetical protein BGZ95_005291 [Linnemannia exigua]